MELYTDGSFSSSPKMGGIGAVIICNDREHTIGNYSNKCEDNNVAEVAAIAYGLKYIRDNHLENTCPDKCLTIFSDSQNALIKINRDYTGKDDFEQSCLDYIHHFIETSPKIVTLFQVKGHVHNGTKIAHYNNIADAVAGEYRKFGLDLYKVKNKRKDKNLINLIRKKKSKGRK